MNLLLWLSLCKEEEFRKVLEEKKTKSIKLKVNPVEADEDFPKNILPTKVNEKTPSVK